MKFYNPKGEYCYTYNKLRPCSDEFRKYSTRLLKVEINVKGNNKKNMFKELNNSLNKIDGVTSKVYISSKKVFFKIYCHNFGLSMFIFKLLRSMENKQNYSKFIEISNYFDDFRKTLIVYAIYYSENFQLLKSKLCYIETYKFDIIERANKEKKRYVHGFPNKGTGVINCIIPQTNKYMYDFEEIEERQKFDYEEEEPYTKNYNKLLEKVL